jgi:hypothetical protein
LFQDGTGDKPADVLCYLGFMFCDYCESFYRSNAKKTQNNSGPRFFLQSAVFEYDVDRQKMFTEMWKKGGIKDLLNIAALLYLSSSIAVSCRFHFKPITCFRAADSQLFLNTPTNQLLHVPGCW